MLNYFLNWFNIHKIVILIVLMSLSIHSNICVSSLWFSNNLFFHYGSYFILHQMPDNILLDKDFLSQSQHINNQCCG